jgi:hypothetical protein
MPDSDDSDAMAGGQVDEPTVEPTVRELLLARIDEHCRLLGLELDEVAQATEQLAPQRARSCRNAITMASVMIDGTQVRGCSMWIVGPSPSNVATVRACSNSARYARTSSGNRSGSLTNRRCAHSLATK